MYLIIRIIYFIQHGSAARPTKEVDVQAIDSLSIHSCSFYKAILCWDW